MRYLLAFLLLFPLVTLASDSDGVSFVFQIAMDESGAPTAKVGIQVGGQERVAGSGGSKILEKAKKATAIREQPEQQVLLELAEKMQ